MLWPPPGLERIQGDLSVLSSRLAWAGTLLVAPLVGVIGVADGRGAFGPLAQAGWLLTVLGVVGLAFALDALGCLLRLLRRTSAAREQGYAFATVLHVLADRNRDMGFLLSGARHFSELDRGERERLIRLRLAMWVTLCAAGLWLLVGMAVGLLAAARGVVPSSVLQGALFVPAIVLYGSGFLLMLVQEHRVRSARGRWFTQPWSVDLTMSEVREWQSDMGTIAAPSNGRRVRIAIRSAWALGLLVALPVLSLVPAAGLGRSLVDGTIPSLDRVAERVIRGEAYRSYRVDADNSVSPAEAGTILHRLMSVGSMEAARPGERPPDVRIERAWIPAPEGGDAQLLGFDRPLWGDSLLPLVARGASDEQRAYLREVASHPALTDFARLAGATAVDVGSARWALPFPEGLTLATLPIPSFASFRDGARAQLAAAAVAWMDGRTDAAEQRLREIISVGFLLAEDGPTLIDNLIGYTLVDLGGTALQDFYRLSGRVEAESELSRLRALADRTAEMGRWPAQERGDGSLGPIYSMTTDSTVLRGIRWEYFISLATIAPCMSLNRIVFGVGEDHTAFVEEARASLVRWPSDEALFELARYGWTGSTSATQPGLIDRIARIYMNSGSGSCGRVIDHMQTAGTL